MRTQRGSAVWPLVHEERRALVQDLRGLSAPRWQTPSLCPDWDVHDVLAHLVDTAKTTRWGFLRGMLAAKFDFDRDNAAGVRRERAEDPGRTLAEFSAVLPRTSTPPAALATRLVEAFVHGEDIRAPLGISRDYPPDAVATALSYQVKTSIKMGGGKERAQGWRLVACDTPFEHGAGPEVRETLDRFRRVVTSTTAASGHTPAWLGEVIVHAQDIRRPLQIERTPPVEAVSAVAIFYAGRDFTVPSRSAIDGLRLEATDSSFTTGDGPLVGGTTLALTMAMAGRESFCDDLEGDGVQLLRSRCAA